VRPPIVLEPTVRVAHDSIELTLPVPPSVNHQYATVKGRRLLSAKGRAYKDLVGRQILVALAQSPHRATLGQLLRQTSLSLSIHFFFASALRRDTDGGLKIAQDALCEGLGVNDNRVVEIHLYKLQDRDNPRMNIRLSIAPLAVPAFATPLALAASDAVPPKRSAHKQRER
jgi:crossover junction endodeoxyribonuclease RusA